MIDYETIVHEWFSKLPMGYAIPPYSNGEMGVLREVLASHGILDEEEDESAPQERFHAKTAEFMKTDEKFKQFIIDRYSSTSNILGLEQLRSRLIALQQNEETYQELVKLLAKGTRRRPSGGTFQLGKYEQMLKDMINEVIEIEGGFPNQLFLSIVYDGKVIITSGADDVELHVRIPGERGLMVQTSDTEKFINFGNLPPNTADALSKLLELYKIVYERDTGNNFNPAELTQLLKELIAPDAVKEFETMMKMSQTSQIGTFQTLSKKVSNILEGTDVRSLVYEFIQMLNAYVQQKLSPISHWIAIPKDSSMVYSEDMIDVYSILKSNSDPIRISNVIQSITENNVRVRGDVIVKKIAK